MSDTASNHSQNSSSRSILIPNNIIDDHFTIRVLTLNCWGLWFGAKKRSQRIAGISRYIRESNCDIVFLQEVWVTSDFEIIRDGTSDIYRFAHLYRSGSVLGSSGIVILCKWVPKVIHFEPYSLNGSPFYPWHGDWFAGKGIAYSRVDFDGLSLHLFSTHTHAYYKEDEPLYDQYSVHRVCQSYQLAKFINFISDTACNRKAHGKDLLIVAGDMNSTSSELPYKILTTLAGLTDCFKVSCYSNPSSNIVHKHKLLSYKQKSFTADDDISSISGVEDVQANTDDEDITYCHPRNSFRSKKSPMKRIDFILCRLLTHGHCVVDRIVTDRKAPFLKCSLSDHEPVTVELKIKETTDQWDPVTKPNGSTYNECNMKVLESTQDTLMQYYKNNRSSYTQSIYVFLFMLIITFPTSTYYALSNDLIPISTVVFMWFAASFVFAILLLVGFLSYRFEQGAIEAILNDITCRMAVAKYNSVEEKSYSSGQNCKAI